MSKKYFIDVVLVFARHYLKSKMENDRFSIAWIFHPPQNARHATGFISIYLIVCNASPFALSHMLLLLWPNCVMTAAENRQETSGKNYATNAATKIPKLSHGARIL